jgi:hypothetical protein
MHYLFILLWKFNNYLNERDKIRGLYFILVPLNNCILYRQTTVFLNPRPLPLKKQYLVPGGALRIRHLAVEQISNIIKKPLKRNKTPMNLTIALPAAAGNIFNQS